MFSLPACLCARTTVTFDLRYLLTRDIIAPKREILNTWKRGGGALVLDLKDRNCTLFLIGHLGSLGCVRILLTSNHCELSKRVNAYHVEQLNKTDL